MIAIRLQVRVSTASIDQAARRLPRAMSDAIVDVLKRAQATQRQAMTQRFTIRRPTFRDQSVKITQFPKPDRLIGTLAIATPGAAARANPFEKFEKGGIKTPRGNFLAVPITGSPAKPSERSIVRAPWKPRALLDTGVPGGGRAFLKNTRSGGELLLGEVKAKNVKGAIGPRLPRARKGQPAPVLRQVVPLFVLVKRAEIDRTLGFVPTVSRAIADAWVPSFSKRWAEQMARAAR